MKKLSGRDDLRERTIEALGSYSRVRAEIDARPCRRLGPGDIFLLFETAEQSVEWAAVARDLRDPGRLLVVPADTHPQVGSADVEVPADERCGPLVLRCAFGAWIRDRELTPVATSGVLPARYVLAAQARWSALESGTLDGDDLGAEVDGDPDYGDWCEMLAEARSALEGSPGVPEAPVPAPLGERSRRRYGPFGHPYALAASILLAVALAFTALQWRREAASGGEALVNLPVAWLTPSERVRGGPTTVSVPGGAEQVLLVLEVRDPAAYSAYRLRIQDRGSGETVWSHDRLTKSGAVELAVVLPRRLLAPGEYRLRLEGLGDDGARTVAEYVLGVEPGEP